MVRKDSDYERLLLQPAASSHIVARASLSTMWAVGRFENMAAFIAVARRMGFGQIEANYQLTKPMISEIIRLRDRNEVVVSSVHDPASLPPGVALSQLPQLSSLDEDERNAALAMSRQAVDIAAHLGAGFLVVHPGNIPGLRPTEARLRALLVNGQAGTKECDDLKRQLMAVRDERRPAHLDTAARSLEKIAAYASTKGVRLGLENRYYYHEIPLVEEASELLSRLSSYNVGYWHDVGHAHSLQVLGFIDEMEWLRRLASRLVGLHLHDALGLKDHLVAGAGEIDFEKVLLYVPADAVLVCEFGSFNSEAEVTAGFQYLRKIGYF